MSKMSITAMKYSQLISVTARSHSTGSWTRPFTKDIIQMIVPLSQTINYELIVREFETGC
ncbi:MAG TPA: hypothetical protein VFM20_02250 [Nitrososphaeraceae archaeon]|nr:hypothetical protein [Nitrososphaeraceae archaeon]